MWLVMADSYDPEADSLWTSEADAARRSVKVDGWIVELEVDNPTLDLVPAVHLHVKWSVHPNETTPLWDDGDWVNGSEHPLGVTFTEHRDAEPPFVWADLFVADRDDVEEQVAKATVQARVVLGRLISR